jgi:hypothetical protein
MTSCDGARWEYDWHPTRSGRYLIISKATDASGRTQPLNPIWNKGGYGNNTVHQIEVTVESTWCMVKIISQIESHQPD